MSLNNLKSIIFRVYRRLVIRSTLNIKFGHYFYENDGGFIANIIGRYVWNRDSTAAKKDGFVSRKNIFSDQLNKEGFVFYDGLIDSIVVNELSYHWNLYCKTQEMPQDYRLQLSSVESLDEIKSNFSILHKTLNNEIIDIVQQFLKSYLRILNIHIYRITTPNKNMMETAYGNTGNWHTDGSTSESLKIMILLSDVSERHGPMSLINLSNTRKIIKNHNFKYTAKESNSFIDNNFSPVVYTGKKGLVMIARTNECFHKATIPEIGNNRDILTFYVTTSSKKIKTDKILDDCKYNEFYGPKRIFL